MICIPEMLAQVASEAGIKVPEHMLRRGLDEPRGWNPKEYPHWSVYCNMQLGAPMPTPGCHFENAKIVAAIPDAEIGSLTYDAVIARGFQVGYSK
jgi:hypothetical protein